MLKSKSDVRLPNKSKVITRTFRQVFKIMFECNKFN